MADFSNLFDPTEWRFALPPNTTDVDAVYYEFINLNTNLSVISVRGVTVRVARLTAL